MENLEPQILEVFFGNMVAVSNMLVQYYNDASATIRILKRSADLSDEDFTQDFQFFLRTEAETREVIEKVGELIEAFKVLSEENAETSNTEEE